MSLLSHCYNSGQVARDIDPVVAKRDAQGEVWEVVVERYLKHMREHRRPSTVYASKCILARVDWKGRRIGTIKWQEIAALLEGIKGNGLTGSPAPVMANRVFAVLRCLFNFRREPGATRAQSVRAQEQAIQRGIARPSSIGRRIGPHMGSMHRIPIWTSRPYVDADRPATGRGSECDMG